MRLSTVQRSAGHRLSDASSGTLDCEQQWKAHLKCHFQPGPDRTIVRREHVGPLTIQRPFYPEGDIAHVYILHPPGGVAAGDNLLISVKADANSRALVSTPGATKFYRSDGGIARFSQNIDCNNSSVEWLPQENIYFNGCQTRLATNITLKNNASLAWWEINCFGRAKSGAPFIKGTVLNTLQITSDSTLLLLDRLVVDGKTGLKMSCGMRANCVTGTLVLKPVHADTIDYVRQLSKDNDGFSSTTFDQLLLVRYLGNCSETAKSGFTRIWSSLRQSLNNKPAQLPRIWAT